MVSVLRYQQLTEIHVCRTDHIACGVQHQHGTRSLMHRVRSGRANTPSALLRIFAPTPVCAAGRSTARERNSDVSRKIGGQDDGPLLRRGTSAILRGRSRNGSSRCSRCTMLPTPAPLPPTSRWKTPARIMRRSASTSARPSSSRPPTLRSIRKDGFHPW